MEFGQIRSDRGGFMWSYLSKIGVLKILPAAEHGYDLSVEGARIAGYDTPQSAAEAVHLGITGFKELDCLLPWELPHGLYQWEEESGGGGPK